MKTYMLTYSTDKAILMIIVLFLLLLYNIIHNFIRWYRCKESVEGTIVSVDEYNGKRTPYYTPICEYYYDGALFTSKVGEKTRNSYIIGTKLKFKVDKNNPTYTYRPNPETKTENLFLFLGIVVLSLVVCLDLL